MAQFCDDATRLLWGTLLVQVNEGDTCATSQPFSNVKLKAVATMCKAWKTRGTKLEY